MNIKSFKENAARAGAKVCHMSRVRKRIQAGTLIGDFYTHLIHQFRSYRGIVDGLKECNKESNNAHDDHNPGLDQELCIEIVLHGHHVLQAHHLVKFDLFVNFNNNQQKASYKR